MRSGGRIRCRASRTTGSSAGRGWLVAGFPGRAAGRSQCKTESYMRSFEYLADGYHVDDAGNLISCTYVDFRDPAERSPITTLKKASSKRHAIPGCGTIRISKPCCFLGRGEGLAGRDGEAWDSQAGGNTELVEEAVGRNGWIYCPFVDPATDEERAAWGGGDAERPTTPCRPFAGRERSRGRSPEWRPSRPAPAAKPSCCGARWTNRRSARPTGARRSTTARSSYADDPVRRLEGASTDLELLLLLVFPEARGVQGAARVPVLGVGGRGGIVPFVVELREWRTPCFRTEVVYSTPRQQPHRRAGPARPRRRPGSVGRGSPAPAGSAAPPPPARSPPTVESSVRRATA